MNILSNKDKDSTKWILMGPMVKKKMMMMKVISKKTRKLMRRGTLVTTA